MLTEKQQKVLVALLSCPTREAAAARAGVSGRTVRRYLKEEEFLQAYRDGYREIMEDATRRMQLGLNGAVDALLDVAGNSEAPPAARVGAARSILENCARWTEVIDLESRISALEKIEKGR